MLALIIDLAVIVLFAVGFGISSKKGFIGSVWHIAALAVTLVLVVSLKTPAVNYLAGTALSDSIYSSVSEKMTVEMDESDISDALNAPEYLQPTIENALKTSGETINKKTNELARNITMIFLNIIAVVGLFIIIRIILAVMLMVLNTFAELPVIGHVNRLAGGLLGVLNILVFIYIICALISLFANADSEMYNIIERTFIFKYFYDYNILLKLILKL